MELQQWKDARFITLTYKPGTTPKNKTLVSEDLSDFFKALRQNLKGRKIKYYACGEYGDRDEKSGAVEGTPEWEIGQRPHYHAIVFGLTSSLEDRIAVFNAWKRAEEFQWFGNNWKECCGTVTKDSCSYVAGYCQKKLFGDIADEEYFSKGRIPPFQHQSNGIGEDYFLEHLEEFKRDGFILFQGVKHPIPETWKKKFNLSFDEQKNEFYQKEKEEYLLKHPDCTPHLYDWYYHKFGYSLDYEDYNFLIQKEAVKELITTRNNLRKKKI